MNTVQEYTKVAGQGRHSSPPSLRDGGEIDEPVVEQADEVEDPADDLEVGGKQSKAAEAACADDPAEAGRRPPTEKTRCKASACRRRRSPPWSRGGGGTP